MAIVTRLATAALAAGLALASAPASAVKPFNASYQASYMGMQGNGRMSVEAAGDKRWRYTLSMRNSLAELTQTTVFEEQDGTLRPLSGTDSSKVLVKKSDKQATYDWSRGVATWTGDVKPDRTGPVKLQPGDLDALLINLVLVRDHAAGKPLKYRMVEDGRIKTLAYAPAGTESITIDGKPQQATKLVNTSGERKTTIWVVDNLPVPARIVQTNKGQDAIDLRVQSLR